MFNILSNIMSTLKLLPKTFKCCHFGEIAPNLVTLLTTIATTGPLCVWFFWSTRTRGHKHILAKHNFTVLK